MATKTGQRSNNWSFVAYPESLPEHFLKHYQPISISFSLPKILNTTIRIIAIPATARSGAGRYENHSFTVVTA